MTTTSTSARAATDAARAAAAGSTERLVSTALRPSRDHLAFSAGIHYCFPDLRVSGRPERRHLRTLRGFEHLPVTLH